MSVCAVYIFIEAVVICYFTNAYMWSAIKILRRIKTKLCSTPASMDFHDLRALIQRSIWFLIRSNFEFCSWFTAKTVKWFYKFWTPPFTYHTVFQFCCITDNLIVRHNSRFGRPDEGGNNFFMLDSSTLIRHIHRACLRNSRPRVSEIRMTICRCVMHIRLFCNWIFVYLS